MMALLNRRLIQLNRALIVG